METLQIAILTENLPPARVNLQPWRYLGDLAKALQAQGNEVMVVTSDDGLREWDGVRVDRHPRRDDFRSARALRQLLEGRGFDAGLCRLTAGLFFSMRGRPRSVRSRARLAGIFLRPLHGIRDLSRRFLDPQLAPEIRLDLHHAAMCASRQAGIWPAAPSFVDRFVFLWDSDRRCATAAGISESLCSVVRHPFDPFFLNPGPSSVGPRLAKALAPVPNRILFTGPPEATRGVDDVLRLPRFLSSDSPTQVLLLLRDPGPSEPLVTRTAAGVHEVLVIRGLLTREELRAAYQASHLAVFPYRFVRTTLPLVALEATAAGLPVVTTRVHPIRELEGRTGLVFTRPRDSQDLARAVRWVLDPDHRKEIRSKNQEWIQSTPDWAAVAKAYLSALRG